MSSEAVAWAFRADLTGALNAGQRLVLLTLADHANAQDGLAWPSRGTIGDRLGMSVRQVARHLADLERLGLITRADQAPVAGIPTWRRPIVYTLRMGSRPRPAAVESEPLDGLPGTLEDTPEDTQKVIHRGDTHDTPPGDTHDTPPGDISGTTGVTPMTPKPKTEQLLPTPPNPPARGHRCPSCGQVHRRGPCLDPAELADPDTIAAIRESTRAAIAGNREDTQP